MPMLPEHCIRRKSSTTTICNLISLYGGRGIILTASIFKGAKSKFPEEGINVFLLSICYSAGVIFILLLLSDRE